MSDREAPPPLGVRRIDADHGIVVVAVEHSKYRAIEVLKNDLGAEVSCHCLDIDRQFLAQTPRREESAGFKLCSAHFAAAMTMSLGPDVEVGEGIRRGRVTGSETDLVGSTRMAVDAVVTALSDLEHYLGLG